MSGLLFSSRCFRWSWEFSDKYVLYICHFRPTGGETSAHHEIKGPDKTLDKWWCTPHDVTSLNGLRLGQAEGVPYNCASVLIDDISGCDVVVSLLETAIDGLTISSVRKVLTARNVRSQGDLNWTKSYSLFSFGSFIKQTASILKYNQLKIVWKTVV